MPTPAALAPLHNPVFRGLWFAWLAANLTMWMNDVAAAWLMTSLTTNPVMVALVQTASTLPVFLLGIPSGAMSDIVDRRRYFASTQLWVLFVALLLALLSILGALNAPLLLALTALNGIGLAMRWPVFAAIVPQVVEREHLSAALALNGISMNLSRVIGPVVAGALISLVNPAAVFVLNALLAAVAMLMILRWRSVQETSPLPGERFVGAMRAGLAFTMQSPRLKVVLLRIFVFFVQAYGLVALLPLVARQLHGGGPATFTVMLSCVGGGAIAAALFFPNLRARFSRDQFILYGTLVHAAFSVLIVVVPEIWVALPAMVIVGMAWISVANSLTLSAQMALPDWIRARGMSIYQTALMGGSAAGALLWGQVADWTSVRTSVIAAAVFGVVALLLTLRLRIENGPELDFTPVPTRTLPEPAVPIAPHEGPVMVTLEYVIDPARAAEFAQVMQATRRARLRQGALSWGLFRDSAEAGRYIEYFVDENWVEHQRRLVRFSASDAALRAQRLEFHLGPEPPLLRRYIAETLDTRTESAD
ncbi:MFS transporter [Aquincola sp. S2]|uniref:MFS transporter n=1 Tax=Pseudaquabacterium terrae TaxID=2732868 RepID=A0ABX2EME6_9BURK|nr:MFS transporter [Aquabacterium terrae]NRF69757.1 MFS transporter [Aquabacterium terrae]